jgi:stalled ribosome rescue protein Dom34
MKAYNEERLEQINDSRALAWNTAALMRCKKMPAIESLMLKEEDFKPKKRQTTQQMMEVAKSITRKLGGTIRRVKSGAGKE